MRRAVRYGRFPLFLTIVLALTAIALPGRSGEAFRAYVLVLAAYGLTHLLVALHASRPEPQPSPVDLALRPPVPRQANVEEIDKIRREVAIAQTTAFDLHARLRPTLRRIASELLRSRRGIDLDAAPERARQALGEETWDLVRADRPPPEDRFAPGIDRAALHRVVESLEAI